MHCIIGVRWFPEPESPKAEGAEIPVVCVGQRAQRWDVGTGRVYQLWQGHVSTIHCEMTSVERGRGRAEGGW